MGPAAGNVTAYCVCMSLSNASFLVNCTHDFCAMCHMGAFCLARKKSGMAESANPRKCSARYTYTMPDLFPHQRVGSGNET